MMSADDKKILVSNLVTKIANAKRQKSETSNPYAYINPEHIEDIRAFLLGQIYHFQPDV